MIVLLAITLLQGNTIGGANASRWLKIPFVGFGFQTSTFAGLVLMMYVARYLALNKDKPIVFKESLLSLWLPVGVVLILILPANFSTTAILFSMVLLLCFVGGYSLKYIGYVLGAGLFGLMFFVLIVKAFPDAMPNRVQTWQNRIEDYSNPRDGEEGYQVEKAKIAIATGGMTGRWPRVKVYKRTFLPQSSSDFIYAIIVEESGLIGALSV